MKNLQPWQAGVSGNPNGRPKGSKNLKTIIRDMLSDPDTYKLLPDLKPQSNSTPIQAIVCTLAVQAISGDVRAADVLLRHSIDRFEMVENEDGFFSQNELVIKVVGGPQYDLDDNDAILATGQLSELPQDHSLLEAQSSHPAPPET